MIRDYADFDTLIARAKANKIDGLVIINCRMANEFETIRAAADGHESVWVTLGTHPHDASKLDEKNISFDEMISRVKADSKIIGIGESGLDYYYDYSTPEDQAKSFRKHIHVCMDRACA
jgi:TatD DNase family protein